MSGFNFGTAVQVLRDGQPVAVERSGVDYEEHRLYTHFGSDVRVGDVLLIGGSARRVLEVWPWTNPFTGWQAGTVAKFEDAPVGLPDFGELRRPTGADVTVDDEGNVVRNLGELLWSGPCSVEPSPREAGFPDLAGERMSVLPFLVTVGLEMVDVQPDDLFQVTSSRDGRLLVRALYVTAIRATSTGPYRELLCRDNQG